MSKPLSLSIALGFCTFFWLMATVQAAPENPYTATYVSKMVATQAPAAAPVILRGKDKDADFQRQLEKGYDMLGYSSFEAGAVPPEQLTEQAVKLNADMALIYSQAMARAPAAVRLQQAKAAQQEGAADKSVESEKFYSYFASFWTKLPPPILGVHVQGTAKSQDDVKGLVVLAVIEDSPASTLLRRGDLLLQLGDVRLEAPENLAQAARSQAGKTVEVQLERDGAPMRGQVTLAKRP